MWTLLTTATVPMPAGAGTLEIPSPDVSALLPVAILCVASILCITVWFLAVSTYTTTRHDRMA